MRPVRGVVTAGAATIAFAVVVSMSSARPSTQPPLTKATAARASRHIESAIGLEHEAGHNIGEPEAARTELAISALALSQAFDLLDRRRSDS